MHPLWDEVPVKDRIQRPRSAYFLFSDQRNAQLRRVFPTAECAEIWKIIAVEWKELDSSIKQRYFEEAHRRHDLYSEQLLAYDRKHPLDPSDDRVSKASDPIDVALKMKSRRMKMNQRKKKRKKQKKKDNNNTELESSRFQSTLADNQRNPVMTAFNGFARSNEMRSFLHSSHPSASQAHTTPASTLSAYTSLTASLQAAHSNPSSLAAVAGLGAIGGRGYHSYPTINTAVGHPSHSGHPSPVSMAALALQRGLLAAQQQSHQHHHHPSAMIQTSDPHSSLFAAAVSAGLTSHHHPHPHHQQHQVHPSAFNPGGPAMSSVPLSNTLSLSGHPSALNHHHLSHGAGQPGIATSVRITADVLADPNTAHPSDTLGVVGHSGCLVMETDSPTLGMQGSDPLQSRMFLDSSDENPCLDGFDQLDSVGFHDSPGEVAGREGHSAELPWLSHFQ